MRSPLPQKNRPTKPTASRDWFLLGQLIVWLSISTISYGSGCQKQNAGRVDLPKTSASNLQGGVDSDFGIQPRTENLLSQWPSLFGPNDNSQISANFSLKWGSEGPSKRWEIPIGKGYSSVVGNSSRIIIHHRINDEELVQCLDLNDGGVIWTTRNRVDFAPKFQYTSGPIPTPIVHEGKVFTCGATGEIQCLDFESGKRHWNKSLVEDFGGIIPAFGYGASPMIHDQKLILLPGGTGEGAGIVALNIDNGEEIWRATDHQSCYATPVVRSIHGEEILFVVTNFGLVAITPDSGNVLWEFPFRSQVVDSENAVTPVVLNNRILISQYGIGSACLEMDAKGSFEEVWRQRRGLDSQYTNLILIGSHVFGFSPRSKRYTEIDMASGKIVSRFATETTRGMAVRVGNKFLVLGDKGNLISFEKEKGEWIPISNSDFLLNGKIFCMPTIIGTQLLVRSENKLVCLELDE